MLNGVNIVFINERGQATIFERWYQLQLLRYKLKCSIRLVLDLFSAPCVFLVGQKDCENCFQRRSTETEYQRCETNKMQLYDV